MPRRTDDDAVVHHRDAADDRANRPPLQLPAVVETVVGIRPELGCVDDALAREIDERQVGIAADRDGAFRRPEVEDAGGP